MVSLRDVSAVACMARVRSARNLLGFLAATSSHRLGLGGSWPARARHLRLGLRASTSPVASGVGLGLGGGAVGLGRHLGRRARRPERQSARHRRPARPSPRRRSPGRPRPARCRSLPRPHHSCSTEVGSRVSCPSLPCVGVLAGWLVDRLLVELVWGGRPGGPGIRDWRASCQRGSERCSWLEVPSGRRRWYRRVGGPRRVSLGVNAISGRAHRPVGLGLRGWTSRRPSTDTPACSTRGAARCAICASR